MPKQVSVYDVNKKLRPISKALHRHCRRHGFESRSSMKFFQAFFSQLLKLRTNCENLSSIWFYDLLLTDPCYLTARIFLPFDLSSADHSICFIYLHSFNVIVKCCCTWLSFKAWLTTINIIFLGFLPKDVILKIHVGLHSR